MNNLGQDFGRRSEQYEKRARALDMALEKLKTINMILNLGMLALAGLSLVIAWDGLTVKHLVMLCIGLFLFRWVANMVVTFTYTNPTMRRIDEENPEPEPFKEKTGSLQGPDT